MFIVGLVSSIALAVTTIAIISSFIIVGDINNLQDQITKGIQEFEVRCLESSEGLISIDDC